MNGIPLLILCRLEQCMLHLCLCCGTCSEHTSYSDPLIPPIEIRMDLLTLEKGIGGNMTGLDKNHKAWIVCTSSINVRKKKRSTNLIQA